MTRFIRTLGLALIAAVAVMGLTSSTAFARPHGIDTEAHGVCGGGETISNLVRGWEEHGAANQAIATTGSHVHLDGSAMQIAKKGFDWVITTKGVWVHNTTCLGHGFTPISSLKFVPAGSRIPVPAWEAPAPGKRGVVHNSFDPHCGNEHPHSAIPVRRPGRKPKKPKPKPKPQSPAPGTTITIVNIVGQQQGQQQGQAQTTCIDMGGIWIESTQKCEAKVEQVQCNQNQVLEGNHCRNKTCQEEGNCPKEKTCEESNEVGVYPKCRPKTCEELHSCTCKEKGLVGEWGHCHEEEKEKPCECKPPPSPPVIVTVTHIDDIEVGEHLNNICSLTEVPGSDTGILVMAVEYSGFGPGIGVVEFFVKGKEKTCVTVYAPHNEVPPGGEDELTVTLEDENTLLSAPPKTQRFRILPEEVHPS